MRKIVLENEKDESVISFIDRLGMAVDLSLVQIVDYWDADLCAIGFKRENRLVYVSTFHLEYKFYYELELLDDIEIDKFTVIQRGDNIAEIELIDIIKEYLKI